MIARRLEHEVQIPDGSARGVCAGQLVWHLAPQTQCSCGARRMGRHHNLCHPLRDGVGVLCVWCLTGASA